MKKFLIALILIACLTLCLCACDSKNDRSSATFGSSGETENTTEVSETEESEMTTFAAQTPGNKTFDISADDMWLYKCTGPNPTDPRLVEITDADTKIKIYNMVKNIIECEPVVYEDPSEIPSGVSTWRAELKLTNGNWYRIYIGAAASGGENFGVMWYQDGETLNESYSLGGEYVAEFYELLGIEQPMIKIN